MWLSEPFVTILIPVFNGVEFLEECLKSIISQTFQEWDVLIGLNGHGTDGGYVCHQILDILARSSDPRIRLIVQGPPLQGKVESLNALLEDVRSTWVALLDCDDIWLPTKLSSQVSAIFGNAQEADIVGTGCHYFGHHSGSPTLPTGWIIAQHLIQDNPIINSSALIRSLVCRKLKWRYPPQYMQILEDYDFWMRAERSGFRLFTIADPLVLHRIHPASAFNTQDQNPKKLQNAYIFSISAKN